MPQNNPKTVSGRAGKLSGMNGSPIMVAGVALMEPKPSCGKWTGPYLNGPQFNSQAQQFRGSFSLAGVSKDSTGAVLADCAVTLYRTGSDEVVGKTTSDGSGNFTFTLGNNSGNFYAIAYKPGAPDVAGTTVNTLVAI